MLANKWVKVAVGAGAVGTLVIVGMASTTSKKTPLSGGTQALQLDKTLGVALSRMETYGTGVAGAHEGMRLGVEELMAICPNPSTKHVRAAETHVQTVKRCIARMRAATLRRTHNNAEVEEEFEEMAGVVLGACDDKLFNLHQAYNPMNQ